MVQVQRSAIPTSTRFHDGLSKPKSQPLIAFDIETIVDCDLARHYLKLDNHDDAAIREGVRQYHLDTTAGKNDFPRQLFHLVVSISYVKATLAQDGLAVQEVGTFRCDDKHSAYDSERKMVSDFFACIDQRRPRLISFNGKTFDMPVLQFRALKYGIQSKVFFDKSNKWENYQHKYDVNHHCDLRDVLLDFGVASSGMKLQEVCASVSYTHLTLPTIYSV